MPWWEPDDWDWQDEYEETFSVICRFCKQHGLAWDTRFVDGVQRHVLVDKQARLHNCRAAKPTEFEDYSNVVPQTSSTTVGRRPVNRPGNPAGPRKQATRGVRKPSSIRAKRARHSRPQAS